MIDNKQLRNNLEDVTQQLARRGFELKQDVWLDLEKQRKQYQIQSETLQAQRNHIAQSISQNKSKKQPVDEALFKSAQAINTQITEYKTKLAKIEQNLNDFLLQIPNIPAADCPNGCDEKDNVIQRVVGTPSAFNFPVKDHIELGALHHGMDLETAAKISGSRFMVLRKNWAKLHRALIELMLDTHEKAGFEQVYVPYIVNEESVRGTGQLPKFKDDLFQLTHQNKPYFLIPTAEVPVTNLLRNTLLTQQKTFRFVCHSPCFRSEAGAYGQDTKGIIRQHQFDKVELVTVTPNHHKQIALDEIVQQAQRVLELLEIPYQINALCSGDLGFSAEKTLDLEAWIPSQKTYREISSCSCFGNFQARRLKIREKTEHGVQLMTTLNGSALAVGRTLVALVENHQDKEGGVRLPEVLWDKMSTKYLAPTNL